MVVQKERLDRKSVHNIHLIRKARSTSCIPSYLENIHGMHEHPSGDTAPTSNSKAHGRGNSIGGPCRSLSGHRGSSSKAKSKEMVSGDGGSGRMRQQRSHHAEQPSVDFQLLRTRRVSIGRKYRYRPVILEERIGCTPHSPSFLSPKHNLVHSSG